MDKQNRNPQNGRVEYSPLYNAPSKRYIPSQDEEDENFNSINRDVPHHVIEGERGLFNNESERQEFWNTVEAKYNSWNKETQSRVNRFIDQYLCD